MNKNKVITLEDGGCMADLIIKKVSEIAPLQRGFDLPAKNIVIGKYPIVYSNGIGSYHHAYMIKAPGLVTGRSGTIGALTYVEDDYWPHNTTLWVTSFNDNNPKYVYYLYHTINWGNYKSGSGVPTLNRNDIHDLELVLVPIPEQNAIAETLSDMDNYITSLEKLIAKKKAIKQGAMQELLTGKRRLPGFEGEWVEKTLDELFDFSGGISASRARLSTNGCPYLHYGDIHGSTKTFVDVYKNESIPCLDIPLSKVSSNALLLDGDVVFVDASEDDEGASRHIVIRNATNKPFISGLHTIIAKSRMDEIDNLFKEFCFLTENVKSQFKFYAVGTKVTGINKVTIRKIKIQFPVLKPEQTAIAAVLADMNIEIEALTAKLNKAKLIKQGMMQELLTGRIRLIKPEATAKITKKPETGLAEKSGANEKKGHSKQFDDGVMIAGIVDAFSSKYPLGRKQVQKLLYLLRRHQGASTAEFKKKAAGPYAHEVRYKGGEPIAVRSKYITTVTTKGRGTVFTKGENSAKALEYITRWGKQEDIRWLLDNFHRTSVDDLELLATVDMAICDLETEGIPVNVESIKYLIAKNAEWKAKLDKEIFADSKIDWAIKKLSELL
jgi:type I restriction enzyme S subunit